MWLAVCGLISLASLLAIRRTYTLEDDR
jgi:hypothetical protein